MISLVVRRRDFSLVQRLLLEIEREPVWIATTPAGQLSVAPDPPAGSRRHACVRLQSDGTAEVKPEEDLRLHDGGPLASGEERRFLRATIEFPTGDLVQVEYSIFVDPSGAGPIRTIEAALRTEADVLFLRPGTYRESVVLDRPVEICGEGSSADIVIESDRTCVLSRAPRSSLRNLTVRRRGGEKTFAVEVSNGNLRLEESHVSSDLYAGVGIRGPSSRAVIARSRIHASLQSGIFVSDRARLDLAHSEIDGNGLAGVEGMEEAEIEIRNCRFREGKASGLYLHDRARATVEESLFEGHVLSGVEVSEEAQILLRRCRVQDGKAGGLYAHHGGRVTMEECAVLRNATVGVRVAHQAEAEIRRSRFEESGGFGVSAQDGGVATIESCEFRGGKYSSIVGARKGKVSASACRILEAGENGVFLCEQGTGTFQDCTIEGAGAGGIKIIEGGKGEIRRFTVGKAKGVGISFAQGASGLLEDGEIRESGKSGLEIRDDSDPTIRRVSVRESGSSGISIHGKARGVCEDCTVESSTGAGLFLFGEADPVFRRCSFGGGEGAGARIESGSRGTLEDCEFAGNRTSGIQLERPCSPVFRGCRILRNREWGVDAWFRGGGRFEGCEVFGNRRGPWNLVPGSSVSGEKNRDPGPWGEKGPRRAAIGILGLVASIAALAWTGIPERLVGDDRDMKFFALLFAFFLSGFLFLSSVQSGLRGRRPREKPGVRPPAAVFSLLYGAGIVACLAAIGSAIAALGILFD